MDSHMHDEVLLEAFPDGHTLVGELVVFEVAMVAAPIACLYKPLVGHDLDSDSHNLPQSPSNSTYRSLNKSLQNFSFLELQTFGPVLPCNLLP